jgi:hypothetical protein
LPSSIATWPLMIAPPTPELNRHYTELAAIGFLEHHTSAYLRSRLPIDSGALEREASPSLMNARAAAGPDEIHWPFARSRIVLRGGANMGLTLTRQASNGRVLRRRTAGGSEQVGGPDESLRPKDASHRPPVTGHQGAPTTDIAAHTSEWLGRGLGRRFNGSDLNNLPEVREPARRRDVALETDDPGQESSSDQT